jgi:hypothetical protein
MKSKKGFGMRAFRTPFVDKLKLPVWAAFLIQEEAASFPHSLSRRFFRGVNDETEYFPIYNPEFICFLLTGYSIGFLLTIGPYQFTELQ